MIRSLIVFSFAVLVSLTIYGCSHNNTAKSPCITECEVEYSKCIQRSQPRDRCAYYSNMCTNNCKLSESLQKIEKSAR